MAIKHGSKVQSAGSAASMTDLMFLLLIFMLLATTLINPNALRLILPKSSNQITEKPYTTISITSDLRYFVETDEVPLSKLEEVLRSKVGHLEEPLVSLHVDQSVPVGEMVKVWNIVKDNKYKLILATQPL